MVLTAFTWFWYGLLEHYKDHDIGRWFLLGMIKAGAAITYLIGSGMLTMGMGFVVDRAAVAAAAEVGIPAVGQNWSALALMWCAAVAQLLGCLSYLASDWFRRRIHVPRGATVNPRRRGPPQARHSFRTMRPREGDPEDVDELPPYQRLDPLGSPPDIDGNYSSSSSSNNNNHNHSRSAVDCVPFAAGVGSIGMGGRGGSGTSSGRLTPSPAYQETAEVVRPVSVLGGGRSGRAVGDIVSDEALAAVSRDGSLTPVSARSRRGSLGPLPGASSGSPRPTTPRPVSPRPLSSRPVSPGLEMTRTREGQADDARDGDERHPVDRQDGGRRRSNAGLGGV